MKNPESRRSHFQRLSVWGVAAAVAMAVAGCLPGMTSDVAVGPSASADVDDVFVGLLRAIEEKRPDKFAAGVDPACTPSRDTLWDALNTFTGRADLIEYSVTVERRLKQDEQVTYVFSWQRKHKDRDSGETLNDGGRTEWTFAKQVGGPYLLVSQVGKSLF
jgi:hypothetical protein